MDAVICTVKYSSGAYVTNTVRGKRASSTMSAEQAAKVLAIKLFPHCAARVDRQADDPTRPGVQRYCISPC